jgi:N-acetylmuramoyl-L-alanine amidase
MVLYTTVAFAAPKICIDPGHGGSDPGATGFGLEEKELNLDKALKLRDWLDLDTQDTAGGHDWEEVLMTRTTDTDVSLAARSSYANSNGVDRFISIHHDAFSDSSANGSSTHLYPEAGSTTEDYGQKVHEELISHGELKDRGVRYNNFHVLRETSMPAVLTEGGFISNQSDASIISKASWQDEVAKGFLHALQRHYGEDAYTPSSAESHVVDNRDTGFAASSNWESATWSSDKYGSSYRFRRTNEVNDSATWQVNLSEAGNYNVYAWWTEASDRTDAAPYIIDHSSGSSVVHKNQKSNGGRWNLLGTYWFNPGKNDVQLSCWGSDGNKIIADAIKWQK